MPTSSKPSEKIPAPESDTELKRSSGVMLLAQIAEHPEVRVLERRAGERPVAEQLLRGILRQSATHAAVKILNGHGSITLCVRGGWQPKRRLPESTAVDLDAQLDALFARAASSCDHGESRTLCTSLESKADATGSFRLHRWPPVRHGLSEPGRPRSGWEGWLISPVRDASPGPSIIDREHARKRRELFERGVASLHAGRHEDAVDALSLAADMAKALGSPSEHVRGLLTLGRAHELAGRMLPAERVYKLALRRVEEAFGRHDLQRIAIFERLSHCAGSRGDRAVSEMWRLRAEHGRSTLDAM